MTIRLTLADPEHVSVPTPAAGVVRFAPATRRRAGVDVGETVRVEGGATTAATIGEDAPDLSADAVLAGDAVRRNADAEAGTSVTVAPVDPVRARRVAVVPNAFSLEGDADALSRALDGRVLTTDDRIEAALFGGNITVPLTVADLDPAGPAVVTAETTVTVRDPDDHHRWDEAATLDATPIGGLDDELATLRRLVAVPRSASPGIRPPAGVLVHGPRGVGKTRLIRRVAADAGLSVHEVDPADCERRDALSAVLRAAADDAPAIIHVPDLAAAAPNPDQAGGDRRRSRLAWLLDRVRDRDDELVVVGEATHDDAVDPAGDGFEIRLTRRGVHPLDGEKRRRGPVGSGGVAPRLGGVVGRERPRDRPTAVRTEPPLAVLGDRAVTELASGRTGHGRTWVPVA